MSQAASLSEQKRADFAGLRILSFESRRAFEMEALIARHGGEPLVAPSMREIPFELNHEALEFARKLVQGKVDVLILTTGVGAKFLAQVIAREAPPEELPRLLSKTTLVARGPKSVAALKELNLQPRLVAAEPNTWREILAALEAVDLKDKKVFVQEYGAQNENLVHELKKRGAHVSRVPVYRWSLPEDLGPLRLALQRIADGRADALLFTNATQVEHFLRVAAEEGLEASVRENLENAVVASLGPIVTETLREKRIPVDFESARAVMGLFVKEAAERCPELLRQKRARKPAIEARAYPPQPFDEKALRDSPFMKACRREPVPYTPVWLMRQAGRYMKDYRDVRSKVGFLELCKNSDLACEVTVTAQERLNADAAIIFSDILLILEPMGVGLEYVKGDGPLIHRPVRTVEDVESLRPVEPRQSLAFVYDAIRKTRSALKSNIPLIGFCGAPFTVASYLIEGRGSDHYLNTKALMYRSPDAWHALMQRIADETAAHLNGQIAAGAQAVQVFDSWIGCLSPADYAQYVQPHMKRLFSKIAPGVPVIHFGTDTASLLELMRDAGGAVIGLDWRVNLRETWTRLGNVAVQGNLDPLVLLSDLKTIREQTKRVLEEAAGRPGHIFNLGHGILPQTPVENVIALVDLVHELTLRSNAC